MQNVTDIRKHFKQALKDQKFTIDRTGAKTIELLGACFKATEPAIFGTPNQEYIDREIDWYMNQSTNVNDIGGEKIPAAWQATANQYGEINSNYGHLILSKKYYEQYEQVFNELRNNPDSRRASMIYTRPSIWVEYNEDGKNDFICTNSVTYYIRDNKLNCVVQMRSNDVVFGYKNDYAWQGFVLQHLLDDLNEVRLSKDDERFQYEPELQLGDIYWQVQNLHVYERHFHLVEGEKDAEEHSHYYYDTDRNMPLQSGGAKGSKTWGADHYKEIKFSVNGISSDDFNWRPNREFYD